MDEWWWRTGCSAICVLLLLAATTTFQIFYSVICVSCQNILQQICAHIFSKNKAGDGKIFEENLLILTIQILFLQICSTKEKFQNMLSSLKQTTMPNFQIVMAGFH
jgi:hypothetical protein